MQVVRNQPALHILKALTPIAGSAGGDTQQEEGVIIPTVTIVPVAPWAQYEAAPTIAVQVTSNHVLACQIASNGYPVPDSNMGYYAHARTYEGQSIITMARVVLPITGLLRQLDFAGGGITLKVYDLTDSSEVYTESLNASSTVFDTPIVDDGWTEDTIGYNFRHALAPSRYELIGAGKKYRLEYSLNVSIGADYAYVISEITLDGILSR